MGEGHRSHLCSQEHQRRKERDTGDSVGTSMTGGPQLPSDTKPQTQEPQGHRTGPGRGTTLGTELRLQEAR